MLNKQVKVCLGLRTSLIFICFVVVVVVVVFFFFTAVFLAPTVFISMSSLFCVTCERNRFLQRG